MRTSNPIHINAILLFSACEQIKFLKNSTLFKSLQEEKNP